jgi:phage minor structural protein
MDKPIEVKRTPVPILYTFKGQLEANLASNDFNTAINIKTSENINEVKKLTFTIPFTKDRKLDYGSNEKLVYFDNILYIIKEMEFEDSDDNKCINVTCEEYCTVLKNVKCENLNEIAKTPREIFNAIVTASKLDIGYQWLGTDVDSSLLRHLITTTETSVYENLISLASVFNGSIEFSYNESGQGFIFLRSKPIYTGKYFKDGIDLKTLNVTYNSDELCSKIYATGYTDDYGIVLDIQAVNGGSSLLEDKSYFIALGVPKNLLDNDAQYNGIHEFSDSTYTDANDLLLSIKL